ncbi:hypothetical protein ACF06W_11590 [Streptomyces albus]|uniref:hypothetical protein n=1 Tax=Streptomyces albus TaxID=1888 RepID=UPI0036FDB6A9
MTAIPISLAGSSVGRGAFTPVLRLITHIALAGGSSGTGHLSLTQATVPGAFADFALLPYGPSVYADPAFAHVTSASYRAGGPGDVIGQWKRLSLTVTTPTSEYVPGHLGRIYSVFDQARLGVSSSNMALGETQQLAFVQFERTPPDQFGAVLQDLEQGSYEGRLLYVPVGGDGETQGLTLSRSTERSSCGAYSGKITYQSPPPTNSYASVANFSTYPHLVSRRQTYADLKYRPFTPEDALPGTEPDTEVGGTPVPAPAVLTLRPLQAALVRVEPGVTYQAGISVACEQSGQHFECAILRFDKDLTLIGTYAAGSPVTTKGDFAWQQASAQLLMEDDAVWAAVVPRVTTGGASRFVFYVDEHRLWVPSTVGTTRPNVSPARSWQPPRQLTIAPRATRVNLVQNPSFQTSAWGWEHVRDPGLTATFVLAPDGGIEGHAGEYAMATAPTVTLISGTSPRTGITTATGQNALVSRLQPDTVYTASLYVKPISCPVPLTIWAHNGDSLVRGTSSPLFDPSRDESGRWFRLAATFKTNSTFGGDASITVGYAAGDVARVYQPVIPGSNEDIWLPLDTDPASYPDWNQEATYEAGSHTAYDGIAYQALVTHGPFANVGPLTFRLDNFLLEQGDKPAPYFDGNIPSADYMWEGAPGDSRSHYYQGKTVNQYRLDQAVRRQLAVGASYEIVYASAP